jgi:hypothetical protein
MEIPRVHWIQWTKQNSNGYFQVQWSIGSNGHFRLAISMAYYMSCSYACHYIIQIHVNWLTEKANVRWIHWTLSFGYLNGLLSTWRPYACHYVIQRHVNWPTEKANVRWKFHLSIGSNGHAKVQWTIRDPFDKQNVQWPFDFSIGHLA